MLCVHPHNILASNIVNVKLLDKKFNEIQSRTT